MRRYVLLTFLVFAVAAITSAKGVMDKVTVTTPDGQTLDLFDPALVTPISMAQLEQFPQTIEPPSVLGKGYELARAYDTGRYYRIFDRVRYFPAGDRGYVFYVGIENGWSEYDGKWFEATASGIAAMNKIIASIRQPTSIRHLSIVAS